MLIINKNVRFSIKLSRLWRVCSILVLQSMVYWIFFVAFSQNRTVTTAVCASLATTIVCHAKAGLEVPRKCFALCFREATAGPQPKWAERKEQVKHGLSQMPPQDTCHLFKGSRVPHYHQRTALFWLCRTIPLPSPAGIVYGPFLFNPIPLC